MLITDNSLVASPAEDGNSLIFITLLRTYLQCSKTKNSLRPLRSITADMCNILGLVALLGFCGCINTSLVLPGLNSVSYCETEDRQILVQNTQHRTPINTALRLETKWHRYPRGVSCDLAGGWRQLWPFAFSSVTAEWSARTLRTTWKRERRKMTSKPASLMRMNKVQSKSVACTMSTYAWRISVCLRAVVWWD